MTPAFAILAILTLAGAVSAMTLRNLVHCALALTISFAGLACFYLQLDAQFAGFAQILVYVGAVAILVVFAILLTRASGATAGEAIASRTWMVGGAIAVAVFLLLAGLVATSGLVARDVPPAPEATVREIGNQLMTKYVVPLEVVGLLLTAAMIGAVIIAMHEKEGK
jgi:NADH-quinone oxidoreductase subunit J